jgi:hypothetical protein
MTAHLEEGRDDPHIGKQFAEFLGLIEPGRGNRSGDTVVKRYHKMPGRKVNACILLVIRAKLGRRYTSE